MYMNTYLTYNIFIFCKDISINPKVTNIINGHG